ncbi:hypothetical protein [Pedobacter gandavensis]|uniref:hypothetical protein n=1 Tax=Pedobacter gandavensis TaxID=2679963 RepID=UPI002930F68A|nr:hypothetical protein [Pedobacter gandavensis]
MGIRCTGLPMLAESYFRGKVKIEPIVHRLAPAQLSMKMLTFEAGAGTHWHSHSLGQTLVVMAGTGWMQPYFTFYQENCIVMVNMLLQLLH